MFNSIMIFGSNQEERQKKALYIIQNEFTDQFKKRVGEWEDLEKHPDVKLIEQQKDKKSIGISDVKEGIKYLQEKPFLEKIKFMIIPKGYLLTRDAQGALLKTLEESPKHAVTIILVKTINDLLDTVTSRCRKISAKEYTYQDKKEVNKKLSYNEILNMNKGELLDFAGEISKEEKEDIVEYLERWLVEARNFMLNSQGYSSTFSTAQNIKKILRTKNDLERTNLNTRLALESLMLNI